MSMKLEDQRTRGCRLQGFWPETFAGRSCESLSRLCSQLDEREFGEVKDL